MTPRTPHATGCAARVAVGTTRKHTALLMEA